MVFPGALHRKPRIVGISALFASLLLALPPTTGNALASSSDGFTKSTVGFDHTPVEEGTYLWFSAVFDFCGTLSEPTRPWHFRFTDSTITFKSKKVPYEVPVPDAEVTVDPAATTAATVFGTDGRWHTTIPAGVLGNAFLTGVPYQIPVGFGGRIGLVTWRGKVTSDVPGVSIRWRWGAAVYDELAVNEDLSVNPIDSDTPAGTPERFANHLILGGTSTCPPQATGQLGMARCVAPVAKDCNAVDTAVCGIDCAADCVPICDPPVCRAQCKEPPPAVCDVKCEKPECVSQCDTAVACNGDDRLCPHCTTVCTTPHCVTHCQAPRPECTAVCEEPHCEWNCSPGAGAGACTTQQIDSISCTAPTWSDDICN